jgi:hypothetical protein
MTMASQDVRPNVFDTNYMQVAFSAPLQAGTYNAFLGAPRT